MPPDDFTEEELEIAFAEALQCKLVGKEHIRSAVAAIWMSWELKDLGMYEHCNLEMQRQFLDQVIRCQFTEQETWHCAIEQVNAARMLVLNCTARAEEEQEQGEIPE